MTSLPYTRSQVLKRYAEVVRTFSRYGFGFVAQRLGLPARLWRLPGAGADAPGRGERLCMALEELGPAYVKLGQMLSTRSDLLPPDVIGALERLQDQVSPFPFAEVERVVETELGAPLSERFAEFSPTPMAAASLGQVHGARLKDGSEVVVKVQRPGVAEQVALDLYLLERLAQLAARRTRWGKSYDLPGVAREFAALLGGELDYRQEAANAERFRANFAQDPMVRFPVVFWDYSTARVLTLERIRGMRVTDRTALTRAGITPAQVAQRLAGAIFQMVLRDGFIHADPHPGNLFVMQDGGLVFIDFGMVGELTPAMRTNVVDYVLGVVTQDSDQVVQAITRMGVVRRSGNKIALRREIERLQRKYGEVPLRQVQFGPALRETLAIARQFEISFPSAYTTLLKAMTTLEAVARQIDPEATLIGLAAPYAELLLRGRLGPDMLLKRAGRELLDTGRYALRIPRQVSRVLALMEEGEVRLALDHTGIEPALQRLSAIANRVAIAILLASLIIGTALVSSSGEREFFLRQYPVADVGFVLIGAFGLWLILSILGLGRL